MKPHGHEREHAHGDQHHHGHEAHPHHEPAATSGAAAPLHQPQRHAREGGNPGAAPNRIHGAAHHHRLDSRVNPTPRGNDAHVGSGLLMTSSLNRVLVGLALIALLWSAVAWAVLFID